MSISSTEFLFEPTDKYDLYATTKIYRSEQCGICEQGGDSGTDTYWSDPISRWAHPPCLAIIKPAEKKLIETIHQLFKEDRRKQNAAHREAVGAVKSKCHPDTLSTYVEKNGIEAITHLFNTFGVAAAKQFAEKVRKNEIHEDVRITKLAITNVGWIGDALTEFVSPAKL